MSLINEALKKAQQDVHGDAAPASRHPSSGSAGEVRSAGRGKLILLGVILLAVVAAGAVWVLDSEEAPAPVAPPRVAPVAKPQPPPAPVVEEPIIIVTPIRPAPVAVPAAPPAPPALPAPVAVVAPVAVEVAVVAAPQRSSQVEAMVELMRVSLGVVRTGRCVVDGIVFKVGDTIATDPLITLKSVSADSVIFTDANGLTYEKKYR